jgi:hypothetical protein
MKLKTYIQQNTTRKDFAKKIGTSVFYLNNICQRPHIAGKLLIKEIVKATKGQVTFSDMAGK